MRRTISRSKFVKSFTVLALYSSFFLGSLSHVTTVSKAETVSKVDEMLANLSPAERAALHQLSTSNETGLQVNPDIDLDATTQTSVIVEFNNKPAKVAQLESSLKGQQLTKTEATSLVDQDHATFSKDLGQILTEDNNKKVKYKVNQSYKHAFNGVSMNLPANQIKNLLKSKAVKAVWSNEEVHAEVDNNQEGMQTGGSSNQSALSFLGVDKLHQEGFTGKGVKVGVIDTGIDYNHPDLKDVYKGGYDFVGNDNDPMETTYEDWKKSGVAEFYWANGASYYTEHGTHVAGIIAGQGKNDSDYKMEGIAPDVDLYAYRVLGPYGSGYDASILAGIDKAVADGMDVINLSLGAGINNPLYSTSIAINQAVLSGVTAVIAAGNSGNDLYTLGSPGTAALALTVGASNAPNNLHTYKSVLQSGTETTSADLQEMAKGYTDHVEQLNGQTFSIIDVGYGASTDYKNKDVKGKVVLISRGNNITLGDKVKFAKQNGATAALLFNNNPDEGLIPSYLGEGLNYISTFTLTNAQGLALKSKINTTSTFTFNELGQIQTKADMLADFSSRGPARVTYDIKPEITAPGVGVFSTVPAYMINKNTPNDYKYAYERLSGTSMATPNVAGMAALLLQAKPSLQPSDVKAILMNTADPLSKDYSVFESGAGRADIYKAVHSSIEMKVQNETPILKNGKEKTIKDETGALSFGSVDLSDDVNEERKVVIKNTGDETKTFDVAVKFQSGLRGSKDADKNGVKISIEPTIKLAANSQKNTKASIFIPKTAEKGNYEGYIVYTNQNDPGETYKIPFAVHAVEEGIGLFETSSLGLSEDRYRDGSSSPNTIKAITAQVQMKSNVRNIDFILEDGKTNQEIGYIGTVDGFSLNEGDLVNMYLFNGTYSPLANSGISAKSVVAEDGFYKIKMLATTDTGKQFTEIRDVVVDNRKPKYIIDGPEGDVIEYEEGQKSVTITGSVFDQDIENYKAAGMKIDQSANKVYDLAQGEVPLEIPVNKDGTFKYDVPIGTGAKMVQLVVTDPSGNGSIIPKTIKIVKKGTPYLTAVVDKDTAKPDDLIHSKIVLKNAVDFKKGTVNLSVASDYLNIENINLHPDSSKLGEMKLTKTSASSVTVEAADTNTQTLNGDIPLVEVTYKVKDYNFDIRPDSSLVYTSGSYVNRTGKTNYLIANAPFVDFVPTYSKMRSVLNAQGLLTSSGTFDSRRDYSKVGADVSIQDAEGNMYNQIFTKYGKIEALHLALTDKPLRMTVNVPGHFKSFYDFKIGMQNENGELMGQFKKITLPTLLGGDVNGDDVIDVLDALYIQTYWGTNKRSADINYDGTIDAKDLAFVEKNYLMQNPSVQTAPKPKSNYKTKTLEIVKSELGL
ncbi:S8 family serine peptidase [Gottfriedia sp. NPDC057948]|uniref:S8 family serine peptidase n=1 Tax=Gottfriedia sp. NPDC057948 TaxID=3346287 RepID=UPI0036DE5613